MKLLKKTAFEYLLDGKQAHLFTLRNRNGYLAQFTNYGGRWLSMWVPDRNGKWADVVLGFENLEGYLNATERYYGAIVGRVCGRINQGAFSLNGVTYQLANNDLFGEPLKSHLHGGNQGFSFKVWDGKRNINEKGEETLELNYYSKDGEEGYPGNVQIRVVYTLSNDNELEIDYSATTDKTTIINLTNHAYFNLLGDVGQNVLDHFLCINADNVIESNDHLIPTGRIISANGTPLDFTVSQKIGARIDKDFPGQLFQGKGYASTYVLEKTNAPLKLAARVEEKESGRILEVYTNQTCLQFYNAWLMDGSDIGKNAEKYFSSAGLALEAQNYPDAPNQPHFPSIVLNPGQTYHQNTIYRFSIE